MHTNCLSYSLRLLAIVINPLLKFCPAPLLAAKQVKIMIIRLYWQFNPATLLMLVNPPLTLAYRICHQILTSWSCKTFTLCPDSESGSTADLAKEATPGPFQNNSFWLSEPISWIRTFARFYTGFKWLTNQTGWLFWILPIRVQIRSSTFKR